jgi:SAM-dependent methyltransferase
VSGSRPDDRAGEGRSRSIAFDRVAEVYDRTRTLPADAMARVLGLVVADIAGKQPCLEIGVGTGRFALPLAARGLRVVGVDLSEPMLHKLLEKAGGHDHVGLILGGRHGAPVRRRRIRLGAGGPRAAPDSGVGARGG